MPVEALARGDTSLVNCRHEQTLLAAPGRWVRVIEPDRTGSAPGVFGVTLVLRGARPSSFCAGSFVGEAPQRSCKHGSM